MREAYRPQYLRHLRRLDEFFAPVNWDLNELTVRTKSGCAIFRRVDGKTCEINLLSFAAILRVVAEEILHKQEETE